MLFTPGRVRAFALLGPFEPWMQTTNGLRQPGDIGGPMDIGNGYRWNVPIVTYGFDQSFLDFFGTNGVAAVQSAIQILNDLPPASQLIVTNYPLLTKRYNLIAQAGDLVDLKSEVLALLIEQMGLAQPSRYTAFLKQWNPMFLDYTYASEAVYWSWAYPDYIACRNFDPITLGPSFLVDGVLYDNFMEIYPGGQIVLPLVVDIEQQGLPAVADQNSDYVPQYAIGQFLTGLTQDDVGGLSYLFSTNNICFENLLADVHKHGDRTGSPVSGARRPGIDKLTFAPQPTERKTGRFLPMVYSYDDKYFANGVLMTQRVERVISKPDFLFSARNLTDPNDIGLFFHRTGTTNWTDNATLNASPEGGPGVITPQVKITLNTIGHILFPNNAFSAQSFPSFWGSFDGSTNAPVVYPISPQGIKPYVINMWIYFPTSDPFAFTSQHSQWRVINSIGSISLFQTSTNMVNWVTMFSTTNDGTSWYFSNNNPTASQQFYRVVPQ